MKMLTPRAYMGLGSGPTRAELLSTGGGCCYLNAHNLLVAYTQVDFFIYCIEILSGLETWLSG